MPHNLPDVTIDLTTEVRWFCAGPLPSAVRSWFTRDSAGLVDCRGDLYRLDEQCDVGVKQRSGRTLELKLRTSPPEPLSFAPNMNGRVETWQRWSPANDLVPPNDAADWIYVDKTIFKRRFDADGRERSLSAATRAMTGDACDAEIAAIGINGRQAWTFAFAAFGRPSTQRDSLDTAWRSLVGRQAIPDRLQLDARRSFGYPEWIASETQTPMSPRSLGQSSSTGSCSSAATDRRTWR